MKINYEEQVISQFKYNIIEKSLLHISWHLAIRATNTLIAMHDNIIDVNVLRCLIEFMMIIRNQIRRGDRAHGAWQIIGVSLSSIYKRMHDILEHEISREYLQLFIAYSLFTFRFEQKYATYEVELRKDFSTKRLLMRMQFTCNFFLKVKMIRYYNFLRFSLPRLIISRFFLSFR